MTYSPGHLLAQDRASLSGSTRMTGPLRRDTRATHGTIASVSPHEGTREKTYQNLTEDMILSDGAARVRRRVVPIGVMTVRAAWTAIGCSLKEAPARQSTRTPTNDAI